MKDMTKMERVDYLWKKYEKYMETAEQHEFPKLAFIDVRLRPYYDDLHANYDEEHADKFIKGMKSVLSGLGIEIDKSEVKECLD